MLLEVMLLLLDGSKDGCIICGSSFWKTI